MRKFNYFKPRYRILDKEHKENILKELPEGKNENAFLWFKFAINMTLKTLYMNLLGVLKVYKC